MPAPTANLPIVGNTVSAEARDSVLNDALKANHDNIEAHKEATTEALALKAPLDSPAFIGTPTGITKAHVGLGNVENIAPQNMPFSGPQQTAFREALDPSRDRASATSGAFGETPLANGSTPVIEGVVLGGALAFGVNPDTGEALAPYPLQATHFGWPLGSEAVEPLWWAEDGRLLAWVEYGEGRTIKAVRVAAEFENLAPPVANRDGIVPLHRALDGSVIEYVEGGGIWSPRSLDAPEVLIADVAGVAQGFVAYDGRPALQATFAQADVTSIRLDRHNAVRYVEGGIADDTVQVALAPIKPIPTLIANMLDTVSWHIPGMGQSLSVGYDSTGLVLTTHAAAPTAVRMFNGGVLPLAPQAAPTGGNKTTVLSSTNVTSLVGASESDNGTNNKETHLTSLGWSIYGPGGLCGRVADVVVSGHGFGGTAYTDMKKGQQSYANMLIAVQAHADLCDGASLTPYVPWLDWVHGEADSTATQAAYLGYLEELRDDIQADIPPITGQTAPPFLLTDQIGSLSIGTVSEVALAALQFGINADSGVCAGPKYMLDFSDGTHLVSADYQVMGEYHAKFALDYLAGRDARPMYLSEVERLSGTLLRLRFHVPVKPLKVDGMNIVTDPGQKGITVWRDVASTWTTTTVLSAVIESADTMLVTLSTDVTGLAIRVGIAMQNLSTQGRTTGPRSIIHDSDTRIGPRSGRVLTNWCSHSRVEVA